jgi:tRNA1(Val) A37 N6-methylase TrmN6
MIHSRLGTPGRLFLMAAGQQRTAIVLPPFIVYRSIGVYSDAVQKLLAPHGC